MRKPNVTSKRVFGAVLTAGLAATAIVSLATASEAASVPTMTLTPASGSIVGGDTLTIKGKALTDDDGTALAVSAIYSPPPCTDATPRGAAGYKDLTAGLNVTSTTKALLVVPTLSGVTAGNGFVCLFDSAVGSAGKVVGSSKYAVGAAPTITGTTPVTSTVVTVPTLGGLTITVAGTNFSKKAVVSIDGVKAVTKFVSATKVTAVVPPAVAGTGKAIKVSTEFGTATDSTNTLTYTAVVKVSPTFGGTASGKGVELTGKGFNAMNFTGTAVGNHVVAFIPAGTTLTAGTTTIASLNPCTSVVVEDDSTLSCKAPALSGAYSVVIVTRNATTTTWGTSVTAVSRAATYTAANF